MFPCFAWSVLFICLVLICEEKKKKNWRNWVQRGGGYTDRKKITFKQSRGAGGGGERKRRKNGRANVTLVTYHTAIIREIEKKKIYMRRKMLIRFTENPFFFFFNDRSKFQQN